MLSHPQDKARLRAYCLKRIEEIHTEFEDMPDITAGKAAKYQGQLFELRQLLESTETASQ